MASFPSVTYSFHPTSFSKEIPFQPICDESQGRGNLSEKAQQNSSSVHLICTVESQLKEHFLLAFPYSFFFEKNKNLFSSCVLYDCSIA